jgi:hypothetical protein
MTGPAYCDESIWIPVADGLRRRGWTVHTARGEETLGDSDEEQLAYAVDNDWLLLTFDDDFFSLVKARSWSTEDSFSCDRPNETSVTSSKSSTNTCNIDWTMTCRLRTCRVSVAGGQ